MEQKKNVRSFFRVIVFLLLVTFTFGQLNLVTALADTSSNTELNDGEKVLKIHVKKMDDKKWNIWSWQDGKDGSKFDFTEQDEYGNIALVKFKKDVVKVGFIVRTDDWEKYGGDRFVELKDKVTEVWVVDEKLSTLENPKDMKQKLLASEITNIKQMKMDFNTEVNLDEIKNKIKLSTNSIEEINVDKDNKRQVNVTLKDNVNLEEPLKVSIDGIGEAISTIGAIVRTPEFDETYYYDGKLGAEYSVENTKLRLWAPTASKVQVEIYDSLEEDAKVKETLDMKKDVKGTYIITLDGDKKNTSYKYKLTFPNGEVTESQDPYGRSAIINGDRTVIINPNDTKIEGFDRMESFTKNVDAIIYEMHIRDFSISNDSGIENKGKFIGVIEKGTKNLSGDSTGLDYLKTLGITHVQILPMYDYASVDENDTKQYNWGYDPENYNVPEGSYSSNPKDPTSRIIEMKQMIKGLHDNGLRVIMDVVYNHVYDVKMHALEKTVPGYYFRYDKNGKLANGTGVGNDTASERKMMRKFMVDSLVYLTEEYKLDGFRFDLMGIHDIKTMQEIKSQLDKIDKNLVVLGEGWDLNTELKLEDKSIQKNANKLEGIAFFNDSIRDSIKGSVFDLKSKGFIQDEKYKENLIAINALGADKLPDATATYTSPNQVIQYAEAHDNLTMFDKLKYGDKNASEELTKERHRLGTSIVLLSQGVPFIHAGQEFLRTKQGDENSYKSSDDINKFDWSLITTNKDSVDYFKQLIAIRKAHDLFRMNTYDEINKNSKLITAKDGIVMYELFNEKERLIVIFNGSSNEKEITIDSKKYTVLVNKVKADNNGIEEISGENIKVPSTSVLVLKEK